MRRTHIRPVRDRQPRGLGARSVLIENQNRGSCPLFDAFSLREPVSTSPENAWSAAFTAAVVPPRLRVRGPVRGHVLRLAGSWQHPLPNAAAGLPHIPAVF